MAAVRDPSAPKIHISSDGLEATITIPLPEAGEDRPTYTSRLLLLYLKEAGVIFGIDQIQLSRLADNPVYDRPIVVATGNPAREGKPGFFTYNFDLNFIKKPSIRPDGSADYMNIKTIETVHKDDVIATYTPAVQGSRGMSVRGTVIESRPVRDLPPLHGRGFDRSRDDLTYTAIIDGKIEMSNNRILISPVHEVIGDVDISTGNIDFNGDVVVHGGVHDGVIIRAAGNVTIDGLVENCEISAGKELYLLSGVKGGEKAVISARGNITVQFVEYASVTAGGNITSDYIFQSNIVCDGKIDLGGKKSAIIGGYVAAVRGIDVNYIGNDFGTVTKIVVGVSQDRIKQLNDLERKIEAIGDNITRIKNGLEDFENQSRLYGKDYSNDPRRLQLLRVKIRDEAIIIEEKANLEQMLEVLKHGAKSTIRVFQRVYPGVDISMDDHMASINEVQEHVEFVKTLTGIRMERLEGVL